VLVEVAEKVEKVLQV